jgi:bacterioferritin-associated ferredoxin
MASKTIVCRCEDVTLDDLAHAAALGYTHIEEAKRYTGLGTGPCQGKECMVACALFLAERRDAARAARKAAGLPERRGPARRARSPELGMADMEPFTSRPPIAPVALGTLARAGEDECK